MRNSCFGCIDDGSQGSDYSDCWRCKNYSYYDEDDEFTEIKKQIRADAINSAIDVVRKYLLDCTKTNKIDNLPIDLIRKLEDLKE